ncbi:hypothetical protein Thein_0223 [Thermodesulfatator indicus DSM 15286]|uniref:CRISPR type III-B/RAMP module-associated protein Cmr5 n=1 Tax=Thermodesulfatator indicus (strain DSM 15286 / JCM 11887 / CIR29812) TaxID=667014 RepID=F8AE46_THEID|nr:hypothetical protein [Thermodesulfatator indicus]AEH44108.1 hypothetical protein Thein_0223 [Thermodesulfatator indicus DSM 15286]
MTKTNLDKVAQDHARKMLDVSDKETLERLVTKALGVLQNQGVYAMMLFLFSRSSKEKEIAPVIRNSLYDALKRLVNFKNETIVDSPKEALEFYSQKVVENLDTLLLVRDLYEQTLIYARFHAKAAKEEQSGSTEEAA